MKRLLMFSFSFLFVGLLYIGCSDNSSIVNPQNSDLTKIAVQQTTPTFFKLPISSLDKREKVKSQIDGAVGGTLEIEGKLKAGVKYEGKLVIPAGAFSGKMELTIRLDKKYAGFIFGPSGAVFNKSLLFTAEIKGLDLKGVDPDNVKFGLVDESGNFIPVVYEKVKIDIKKGKLEVRKARLDHFSRYNWAK